MKNDKDKEAARSTVDRRGFLRVMGAGAGLAATAAAPLATEAAASESASEKTKARYNPNSEHVKTFYRVNGY